MGRVPGLFDLFLREEFQEVGCAPKEQGPMDLAPALAESRGSEGTAGKG